MAYDLVIKNGVVVDGSGSAQPGRLALYNPTIPLTDYRLEFQGQILSKALGMALRAAETLQGSKTEAQSGSCGRSSHKLELVESSQSENLRRKSARY